jgi:hypothetical protein
MTSSRDSEWGAILDAISVIVMDCEEDNVSKEPRSPKGKEPMRDEPQPNLVDDGKLEDTTIRRNSSCTHERPSNQGIGYCEKTVVGPGLFDKFHLNKGESSKTPLAADPTTLSLDYSYGQLDGASPFPSQPRHTSFATAIWGPKTRSDSRPNGKCEQVPAVPGNLQASSKNNPFRKPKGSFSAEKEPLCGGSSSKGRSARIMMEFILPGGTATSSASPTGTTSAAEHLSNPIHTETLVRRGGNRSSCISPKQNPIRACPVTEGKGSLAVDSDSSDSSMSALVLTTTDPIAKSESFSNPKMLQYLERALRVNSLQNSSAPSLASNPTTQKFAPSNTGVITRTPVPRSPLCLTDYDETEMPPSLGRVSKAHSYDPDNIYNIQQISFPKFVQPETSLPKGVSQIFPKWPKYRYDGFWEWNVATLDGQCTCTDELFLERDWVSIYVPIFRCIPN